MKIATMDIEATNWINFELLGFYDGKDYKEYHCLEAFLDDVLSYRYRGYRIYAHFGGKYDFLFLLPLLLERDLKIQIMDSGSRIIQIKVKGKNNVYFIDSYALLPMSLHKLTHAFDVMHKKQEADNFTKEWIHSAEGREYLKFDTIGLFEVLEKFRNWGLHNGKLKCTLAMQSMTVFKDKFMTEPLQTLSEKDEEFIRRCYYGGRCEIFKMSGKNLNYYDFNSLYPYVMLKSMPCGSVRHTNTIKNNRIGFYFCDVYIPANCLIPPIPIVKDGKLLFPTGRFKANITSEDYKLIKLVGGTAKVRHGIYFTGRKKIFKDYIERLYRIKENAKSGSVDFVIAKLEMNSLYGKFGQRRERTEIVRPNDYQEVINKGLEVYMEELGLYKRNTISKSKHIFPYISAYITSLARSELYKLFLKVGFDHVWYCDTDSIITDKKLKTGEKLGQLKLEYKIKEGIFLQPKGYAIIKEDFCEKIRLKGFSEHKLTFNDFKLAMETKKLDKLKAEMHRVVNYKENCRRFKNLKMKRIKIIKQLRQFYNKRIVLDNFNTKPHNINN